MWRRNGNSMIADINTKFDVEFDDVVEQRYQELLDRVYRLCKVKGKMVGNKVILSHNEVSYVTRFKPLENKSDIIDKIIRIQRFLEILYTGLVFVGNIDMCSSIHHTGHNAEHVIDVINIVIDKLNGEISDEKVRDVEKKWKTKS